MNAASSRRSWRGFAQGLALLVALGLGAALLLVDPAWLQTLRNVVFDQYQRWHPRVWQDTAVRVIDVDEESLARVGQWPWPRTRVAQMVQRMQDAQAAAIGFDVMFAEPDRTSPKAMADVWKLPATARPVLDDLPDHDVVLAAAIARGGVVLGFSLLPEGATPSTDPPMLPQTSRFVQLGEPAGPYVHRFGGIVAALPALAQAAAGNGALAFVPDNDGVVRRVPLVLRVGDAFVPTLSAELLRVGQGQTNYLLRTGDHGSGLTEVRIGQVTLPTNASGEVWVHYTTSAPGRTIPAWKVLEGAVPASDLQNRVLLVGSSAQGLMDLRFSPLGSVVPGVEVHAQALEQALTDGFLYRPSWARAAEALALLAGGLLAGIVALTAGPALSALLTVLLIAALAGGGWYAFVEQRLLLDPLLPSIGVFLAFLLPSVLRHQASEQRRRWVAQAFSRYVSPNLVTHIVRHPEELELGGRRQQCSFIFTDLAGFTTLMEKIDPAAAVGLLNEYLDHMIGIAFRHHGTLDRIIGDAVAIMFSAPVPQPDHQQRAYDCALEMQRYAAEFAARQQAAGIAFGHTRIGVHSGEVIVGNFGGSTMFDYRALGDAVNTAARLEGANKYLGTRVCISSRTLSGCQGAVVRRVARVVLKGKSEPLLVYNPLHDGLEGAVDAGYVQRYEAAYESMAADQPQALAMFEALSVKDAADPLVRLHLKRLRAREQDGKGDAGDLIVLADK